MELISTVIREIGKGPGVRLDQKTETNGGYFVARKVVQRPPRLRDLVSKLGREGQRQYVTWEVWGVVVEG